MGILNGFPAVRRRHKFTIKIDPILERKILHPPVAGADVVGHDVVDEAQALGACLGQEGAADAAGRAAGEPGLQAA